MDSEDESSSYSDPEVEEYEEKASMAMKEGKLAVENGDGSYHCPFSPGKKKQDYKYSDLLQHAKGLAKGKRSPKAIGNHRALEKFLMTELAARATPKAKRQIHLQQQVPPRVDKERKLVFPWMGLLYNINNSQNCTSDDGFRRGPGPADLKEKFQAYNPESVKVFYDAEGHLGMAVVEFRSSVDGLKDAEAFENSFIQTNCGRKQWFQNHLSVRGPHLYSWQATKQDCNGPWSRVTEFLQKTAMKSVSMLIRENVRKLEQQVENLKEMVSTKDEHLDASHKNFVELQNMVADVERARVHAEQEKMALQEQHKIELSELQAITKQAEEENNRVMLDYRRSLEGKMQKLESQCALYRQLEKTRRVENEVERRCYEAEKLKAQQQLEDVTRKAEKQKAQQLQQIQLIKKHEGETKKLEMHLQAQRKKLAKRQKLDLDEQHVAEILEVEKGKEAIEDEREHREKIRKLEEKLQEIQEEKEMHEDLVNVLTVQNRVVKEELNDAQAIALDAVREYGIKNKLHVRCAGNINMVPWNGPCEKRFQNHKDRWEECMMKLVSEWQERLGHPGFVVMKTVQVHENKWERRIDETNKMMNELRDELGPAVVQTVVNAHKEILEHNGSGSYVTALAWNFTEDRQATLKEVIARLLDVIEEKKTMIEEKEKMIKEKEKMLSVARRRKKPQREVEAD